MELIQNNLWFFSILFFVFGFGARHTGVMHEISRKRGEQGKDMTISWYVSNRKWKIINGFFLSVMGAFVIFVSVEPHKIKIDPTTYTDNIALIGYLVGLSVANLVIVHYMDKWGTSTHHRINSVDSEIDDRTCVQPIDKGDK